MNAVGMVLVNGLQDKAEWTSYQYGGNAVIDLIWVEADRIGNFRNCKVWNEDAFVIGDHRMISIDGIWEVSAEKSSRGVEKEESVTGWNINDKGNKDYWTKLVESGNILMSEWMNKVIRSDSEEKIDSMKKVEELWSSWLVKINESAEIGVGRRNMNARRSKFFGWDRKLAKLVERRNACRRKRDNRVGEDRKRENEELKKWRGKVKQRVTQNRNRMREIRNKSILRAKTTDSKRYWDLLKKIVGVGKFRKEVPNEAWMEGKLVSGDLVKWAWQQAFQKLGEQNDNDILFEAEFLVNTKKEVMEAESSRFASTSQELDVPISKNEVRNAIKSLKRRKAVGVDKVASEILKYGGEGIGDATWTSCHEMFRLERIPEDWARGLIFPLHKEGDTRVPDNYRGITLLSVVGKMYANVLNKRISQWCEKNDILSEEQAGFRTGRSTIDHIFSLSEVVRSRMSQGLETHCCF